jgi:hypothetical protein
MQWPMHSIPCSLTSGPESGMHFYGALPRVVKVQLEVTLAWLEVRTDEMDTDPMFRIERVDTAVVQNYSIVHP